MRGLRATAGHFFRKGAQGILHNIVAEEPAGLDDQREFGYVADRIACVTNVFPGHVKQLLDHWEEMGIDTGEHNLHDLVRRFKAHLAAQKAQHEESAPAENLQ